MGPFQTKPLQDYTPNQALAGLYTETKPLQDYTQSQTKPLQDYTQFLPASASESSKAPRTWNTNTIFCMEVENNFVHKLMKIYENLDSELNLKRK